MMMHRQWLVLGFGVVLFFGGQTARAQYYYPYGQGYGGYGFGGWGQTVQGSTAAGMGAFAAAAGQYNYQTAVANSINANTVAQWNNYAWTAQNSLNQEHYARMVNQRERNTAATSAIATRIRDNPNQSDIDRGDALNAILGQLTYPKVLQGSGLARATEKISAKQVKNIPFRYAPAAVVICIDRYKNNIPPLLQSKDVETEREAFAKEVKSAVAKIKAGEEVSPEEVDAVRKTGRALYSKVETGLPNATLAQRTEALNYLKSLKAYLIMLKNPDFAQGLRELDKINETTVGNLVAFMHTFSLRFGPATTQEQKAVYRTLYPLLRKDRDKVMAMLGPQGAIPDVAEPPPPTPGELFQGVDDKNLGGNR